MQTTHLAAVTVEYHAAVTAPAMPLAETTPHMVSGGANATTEQARDTTRPTALTRGHVAATTAEAPMHPVVGGPAVQIAEVEVAALIITGPRRASSDTARVGPVRKPALLRVLTNRHFRKTSRQPTSMWRSVGICEASTSPMLRP